MASALVLLLLATLGEGAELVQVAGMKLTLIGLILCLCFGGIAQAATPVKSYREWKAQKIQVASSQIGLLKARIASAQIIGHKEQSENIKKQIDQEQWNLDVAKDLSVTDYFVLYLSQIPDADRFKQAAVRMSVTEIEEMMKAYSEAVGAAQTPSEDLSQSNKLPIQAGEIHDQMK